MTEEEAQKFESTFKNRAHVVILGAGATVAAIPNGDKNGLKSSVMNNFIEDLGMTEIISSISLKTKSKNLEDIYTEISERPDCKTIKEKLDKKIREHFLKIEIPDSPNIYDLILLSLTNKDFVATFNWDPLLLQAYQRCIKISKNLPELAFLHGNVLTGQCPNDHKCGGHIDLLCPECHEKFSPSQLLYPIKNKGYSDDKYLEDNWRRLKRAIKKSYILTIFGYSAPKTDAEAINMLHEAWGNSQDRYLEQTEIIDIQKEENLQETWGDFIHSHHVDFIKSFFESRMSRFPRRTTIELFDQTMNCKFTSPCNSFHENITWEELVNIINKLTKEEQDYRDYGNIPLLYD